MWIDTHCHLDFEPLNSNIECVLNLCYKNKVNSIIVPSVKPDNIHRVIELSEKNRSCFYALGFHPMYVDDLKESHLYQLEESIKNSNPIAVGEIGLDLFISKDNLERQEYFLSQQLLLAKKYNLPVILHVRSAIDMILKHLRKIKVRGGVAHAFNGSFQQAEQFIKMGFKLGIGGAITYPRARHLQKIARELPLKSIVLETDAPDMPPIWRREKGYNRPSEINQIGIFLAELRGMDPLDIAENIRVNTQQVFPKLLELCT
tara:strand:- start:1543 stop:2322 length:780 start_codon:yes stop_codon:yes gene_type:complete